MEYFAGYGFNKSHSTAYAFLAYQTAYLKANYPRHFAAALLTIEAANTDKLALYITESRERGIAVLPPDINESQQQFSVVPERRALRPDRHQGPGRGRHPGDPRRARPARAHHLAAPAGRGARPAHRQPPGVRGAGQERRLRRAGPDRRRRAGRRRRSAGPGCCGPSTPPSSTAPGCSATASRARPTCSATARRPAGETADRRACPRRRRGPRWSGWPTRRRRSGCT